MKGRNPDHFGESLSPRGKWIMGVVGVAVLVIAAGVGIWSAVHPSSYDGSRGGCVTVNMVSSTGGAVIHDCGAQARALCKSAFSHNDKLSRLTRTQCRLAGLGAGQQP